MPVQINISGENASQAMEEFAILAAHFTGGQAATPAAETKQPRSRKAEADTAKQPETPKAEAQPASEPEPAGADDAPVPTVVDLRAKAQAIGTTAEGKAAIKALLEEFGSKSITELPEGKRAAFLARLGDLG